MRFFALLYPKRRTGYPLAYYPEEEKVFRQELGKAVIGDFSTAEEAKAVIYTALRKL